MANLRKRLHNVLVASIERANFYQLQSIGIERAKLEAAKRAVPDRALMAMVSASWTSPVPLVSVQVVTGHSARALEKEVLALIRAGFAHWRGESTLVVSPTPIPRDHHRHSHRYTHPNRKVNAWSASTQASRVARRDRRSEKLLPLEVVGEACMLEKNGAGDPTLGSAGGAGDPIQYTSITTSEEIFAESLTPRKNGAGDPKMGSELGPGGVPCAKSNVYDGTSSLRLEGNRSSLRSDLLSRGGSATRNSSSDPTCGSHATIDIDPTIIQSDICQTTATDHSSSTTPMPARSPMQPSSSPAGSKVKSARRGKQEARPSPAPSAAPAASPPIAKPMGPSAWQGLKDSRFGRVWDRWYRAHHARDERTSSREAAYRAWADLKPDHQDAAAKAADAYCAAYEADLDRPIETLNGWLRARGWKPAAPKVAANPEKRASGLQKRSGGPSVMTPEAIWLAGCQFLLKTGKGTLLPGNPPLLDWAGWKAAQRTAFVTAMKAALEQPGASAEKLRSACPDGYMAVTGQKIDLLRDSQGKRVKAHFEARAALGTALLATETKMAAPPRPARAVFTQQELEAYCRDVGLTSVA